MLVNGVWTKNWQPVQDKDAQGRFVRQTSSFRNWITADGSAGPTGTSGFKAEKDRYHLYVAYICPWACRTLMVRELKQLTDYISVTVVNPKIGDQGWQFGGYPGSDNDSLNDFNFMHELYSHADPQFTGRATVPVLWDKKQGVVVSNESADILRMLNSAFDHLTGSTVDLYPAELRSQIDIWNEDIYNNFNNGVYKAGFATTQFAYEEAFGSVFSTMDKLEAQLQDGRNYIFGNNLTETDIRVFVTLIRFDVAYFGLFKCNRNQVSDMPNLYRYMKRIYDLGGIKNTVNIDHIKQGYYSIKTLNPTGIVPVGPEMTL
jgi:putative glutathione S-transferase